MKLSNTFAFASIAAFGSVLSLSSAQDVPTDALVDATITVEVATTWREKETVKDTIQDTLDEEVGMDLGEAVTGEPMRRNRDRELANVIILDGTTHKMDVMSQNGEIVTIEWNSVDYSERTVPCSDYGPLGGTTCYQFILQYRAIVLPNGGVHQDNIDSLAFPHIKDAWKDEAKALLKSHVEEHYEGKVITQVRVDDHIHVVTWGDPHFKTFGSGWFDYMGACDLKMIHAPNFDGPGKPLDIDMRTKIRYDYSYVEAAAIKLGDDILEVASFGDYWLNGVSNAAMPALIGGYPVTKTSPSKTTTVFTIEISPTDTIVLKNFKDMVAVILDDTAAERFQGSLGMVGSFDKHGTMVGRDGETVIEDPNAFAEEWQIRDNEPMLFSAASSGGPQYPQKCQLPSPAQAKGRRLGATVALEAAKKACAKWAADNRDACVHDVMATGDLELAAAGAY